jgi:hypothetical protein
MANPNLNAVSSVYGDSSFAKISGTTVTSLLANAASSGKILLTESVIVANTSNAAVNVTVQVWSTATAGTGTGYAICSTHSVAAYETLVVVSKDTPVKLKENQSLSITAGTANALDVNLSWTELS